MVSLIESERPRNDKTEEIIKVIEFIENLIIMLNKWNSEIDEIINKINLKIESLTLRDN